MTTKDAPIALGPLTAEEEDQFMVARIAQEDQATFKRLAKKYQQYLTEDIAPVPLESRPVYLSELCALRTSLGKARIVCEAEKKQAKEYLDLREELLVQQGTVKEQLESLREILDMEQEIRTQKVEYDEIAIKVNALPTRTRLVADIKSLESEIRLIETELEAERKIDEERAIKVEQIFVMVEELRRLGKGDDVILEDAEAMVDTQQQDVAMGEPAATQTTLVVEGQEMEEGEEVDNLARERHDSDLEESETRNRRLNPRAPEFRPRPSMNSLRARVLRNQAHSVYDMPVDTTGASSPAATPPTSQDTPRNEDVEMGEVTEEQGEIFYRSMAPERAESGELVDEEGNPTPVFARTPDVPSADDELEEGEASDEEGQPPPISTHTPLVLQSPSSSASSLTPLSEISDE